MTEVVDTIVSSLDKYSELKAFVKNKVRLDGRNFGEYRVASAVRSCFDSPGVIGSSRVQFGGTAVVCGINIMVGVPSTKEPSLGDVVCNCVLAAGVDVASLDQRSKSNMAFEIESTVLSIITKGNVIDLEQLSIIKGRYAYRLCVNITCLNNAGNLLDTAILAAVTALQDSKLPLPVQRDDTICVNNDILRPLQLEYRCIPVTVGWFDGALLADPSEQEEAVLQGTVTCVFAMPSKELCYMRQSTSGAPCSFAQVEQAVSFCLNKAEELQRKLNV